MNAFRPEPESTIDELIATRPFLTGLLAKLELFCRRDRTLLQACCEAGLEVEEVLALIGTEAARFEEVPA